MSVVCERCDEENALRDSKYCDVCAHAIANDTAFVAEEIWNEMMQEARQCRRTWGMGFPVISTFLLRKYWHKATGWMPPEEK